jgi:glycosyltransferase involved in cell wall biosynthesis
VALVVSNLEYGGAQRQVVALANHLNASGGDAVVVSLSPYVPLASALQGPSSRLHVVEKRHRLDLTVPWRLARLLRKLRVEVTHAFLVDAEIAARLAGALYPRTAILGSERNADYTPQWRHRIPLRLTRPWCDAVIANSNAGKRFQQRVMGVPGDALHVVHNGVDLERFAPREGARAREETGLAPNVPVVGMFASFKTQKNHPMFFRMAHRVQERHPGAVFLCVGEALHLGRQGSDTYAGRMRDLVRGLGLEGAVRLVGNQDDLPPWYASCDVTVLTSYREGTPNVLLESMACGVPVVATDVADNKLVVGQEAGFVVAPDDDQAMADRVSDLLDGVRSRLEVSRAARAWVEREFSLARLTEKTSEVYREVLERRRSRGLR